MNLCSDTLSFNKKLQLPHEVIQEGIALYVANHCNQPCPLARHYESVNLPLVGIPMIVLAPMLALSLRASNHAFFENRTKLRQQLVFLSQLSWSLLTKAYHDFQLDDDYLEGLCLLALFDIGGMYYALLGELG
jgi:hypothetical protein